MSERAGLSSLVAGVKCSKKGKEVTRWGHISHSWACVEKLKIRKETCTSMFIVCPGWTVGTVSIQSPLLLLFSCSVVSDSLRPHGCSMPGFPVLHHLLELAQTHVHWVSDSIQPSCPLLSPSPPAFNLSFSRPWRLSPSCMTHLVLHNTKIISCVSLGLFFCVHTFLPSGILCYKCHSTQSRQTDLCFLNSVSLWSSQISPAWMLPPKMPPGRKPEWLVGLSALFFFSLAY